MYLYIPTYVFENKFIKLTIAELIIYLAVKQLYYTGVVICDLMERRKRKTDVSTDESESQFPKSLH